MKIATSNWLYLSYGILIFLFIGIYWWSLPYNMLSMEDAFVQWSVFIIVVSFVFRYFIHLDTRKLIISSIIATAMVIIIRFIHDILQDDSTHSLVLLELVIAFLIGSLGSSAGVFLANMFVRQKKKDDQDDRSKAEIENTKRENKSSQ